MKVNPPIAVLSTIDLNSVTGKRVLIDLLNQLWLRTGGGDDQIYNQSIRETYPWVTESRQDVDASSGLNALFVNNPASSEQFDVVEVAGTTHTTRGNEIVICSNTGPLLVTLNQSPDHKEQVIIVRQGVGAVSVTSTKLISGKTTKTILRRYSAPHHIFTTEADSWSVI